MTKNVTSLDLTGWRKVKHRNMLGNEKQNLFRFNSLKEDQNITGTSGQGIIRIL